MKIANKIYNIDYDICGVIFINHISVNSEYRNRGYCRRILDNIQKQYKLPIVLECWPTLLEFYLKLDFEIECDTIEGYIEMKRDYHENIN